MGNDGRAFPPRRGAEAARAFPSRPLVSGVEMNGVMDELEGTGSSSDHRQLLERSALASSDGGETWHIPWARGYTEDAHLLASKEAKVGILFQDAHILVVDKPAFLPSENTRAIKDSVRSRIEDLLRVDADPEVAPAIRVYLPHRLDWETSGVLIIARTREAHRALSMQFEARQVRKVYIADVIGSPPSSSGVCELPLSLPMLGAARCSVSILEKVASHAGRRGRWTIARVRRRPPTAVCGLNHCRGGGISCACTA